MAEDYNPKEYKDWQAPPAVASEDRKLGFLNESTEEGLAWLRSQRGFPDFHKALNIISGTEDRTQTQTSYRSKVSTNRLKRNVQEITGTLAKLRPMWGYYSDNKAYADQAEMFNKVARFWYLKQMADRTIKKALDYAAATGRGWVRPVYRRNMGGAGHGDIKLFAYGAPCVLPNQLPQDNDWQEAYVVHIIEEMPIYLAHAMFPNFQNRLRPTTSRYWYMNDGVRAASTGNWMQRAFGKAPRQGGGNIADVLVPLRFTYVIDLTMNTTGGADGKTGMEIPMGEPGASWSYTVPYIGQRLPNGADPEGKPQFRTANENDARLYPYRRLIISSESCVMYDGPGFDWHGMLPAVSFCLDDWPWEPNGFSLVHDGYELQNAINELARGNMDKARSQLNMSLGYDINAVSQKEAERFDPMQPRARVGYDGMAMEGTPFQPIIPPEVLKIEPESGLLIKYFEETLDTQQGIHDIMALSKMRAVGSMDDIEKIMEANGPIVENMSRGMEPPMRDLGIMIKYDIMQNYTTARVMQIVGPDGVTPIVFDYDPSSVIPSHLPGENPEAPSAHTAAQRARVLAENLTFYIMPNTLHEMQQMTMKLGLLQLKKTGVKIDSQTVAEAWNIPNYGTIDGNTVLERVRAEAEMDLIQAGKMMAMQAALGGNANGAPPGAPQAPPPPAGEPPPQEGRPPTFSAPPTLQSKDNGARSTIATSK